MDWWAVLDGILINLYHITGWPVPDYFIGTFLLAMITVVLGDFTTSLVYRANRGYYRRLNNRLREMNDLSFTALKLKDKASYKATNREANDTFGLLFFSMFGLSAAYLWPALFALAWMQSRFAGVGFPLFIKDWQTSYFFTFLVVYILARLIFTHFKPRLPYFKHVVAMEAEAAGETGGKDVAGEKAV